MNIPKEQLPVSQFERLGIDKERIDKFSKQEMHALLSGYPSNMKFLAFKDHDGVERKVNARISVYQQSDGRWDLKVHPFRPEIKNDMGLSSRELDRLKTGDVVVKKNREKLYLVQLDPATNELRKIRTDHIVIPDRLANTSLSDKQKVDLLNGKVVTLHDRSGKRVSFKIDLLHPRGFSSNTTLDKHVGNSLSRDTHQSPSEEKTISRTSGIKIGR